VNDIKGYREFVLIHNDPHQDSTKLPFYAKKGVYLFMSFIFMSWVFRFVFVSASKRVVYRFRKLVIR